MADITGVLLAAGFSTRFGDNKPLHEIDGRPLIAHSVAALQPCDRIIAVVRKDEKLQSVLDTLDIECVLNPLAERGMGSSIACAVKASLHSSGWCLLPADMPCIDPATTQQLVDALRDGAALAAPSFQGQRGHPVAIGKRFAEALSALDGDTGARAIVERNIERMTLIAVDDDAVLTDIDTPADIECIRKYTDSYSAER